MVRRVFPEKWPTSATSQASQCATNIVWDHLTALVRVGAFFGYPSSPSRYPGVVLIQVCSPKRTETLYSYPSSVPAFYPQGSFQMIHWIILQTFWVSHRSFGCANATRSCTIPPPRTVQAGRITPYPCGQTKVPCVTQHKNC